MKKIKKFLESKELNTWGFKYYDTIKNAIIPICDKLPQFVLGFML